MRRVVEGRELVGEPVGLAEIVGTSDARLFPQFAKRGGAVILALIDAALRHLPFQARQDDLRSVIAKAPADQDAAVRVEQRDPDIGAIGPCFRHPKLSETEGLYQMQAGVIRKTR